MPHTEFRNAQQRRDAIAAQNDALRRSFATAPDVRGRVVMTRGVAALPPDTLGRTLSTVARFDTFTPDNDPYGERDFGAFTVDGLRVMFKIDYYADDTLRFGADDPLASYRVLTIMLADEY